MLNSSFVSVETHYDLLVGEGNDPVHDPPPLRDYMSRYDGSIFFEAIGQVTNLRILEIGIGTGRLAAHLLPQRPASLVGLDVSAKALAKCKLNFRNERSLSLVKASFPYWVSKERFDVIYSSLTFMHIPDLSASMRKIKELLYDVGKAVISFSNHGSILDFGTRRVRLFPHTGAEIEHCASDCGFRSSIHDLRDGDEIVAWFWTGAKV